MMQVAVHGLKGNYRLTMEDAHLIYHFNDVTIMGVMDGHGGIEVAQFVSEMLPRCLEQNLNFLNGNYKDALVESFQQVDRNVFDHVQKKKIKLSCGSTAVVALFSKSDSNLVVANAGDARAVLYIRNKDGTAQIVSLSRDHKAGKSYERERLLRATNNKNALAPTVPSRGFGDFSLKLPHVCTEKKHLTITEDLVTSIPEIQTFQFDFKERHKDAILILACDGVWDKITNEEAAQLCAHIRYDESRDAQICAQLLAEHALCKKSMDNVSVIINYFN